MSSVLKYKWTQLALRKSKLADHYSGYVLKEVRQNEYVYSQYERPRD